MMDFKNCVKCFVNKKEKQMCKAVLPSSVFNETKLLGNYDAIITNRTKIIKIKLH